MNRIQVLRQLCGYFDQIVQEETRAARAKSNDKITDQIFDRHVKNQQITRLRERILRRVRTEIWEKNPSSSKWEVCTSRAKPTKSWKPVGYLKIATILGGDHSTWVKMAKGIGLSAPVVEIEEKIIPPLFETTDNRGSL